jgi:hypothetical protein
MIMLRSASIAQELGRNDAVALCTAGIARNFRAGALSHVRHKCPLLADTVEKPVAEMAEALIGAVTHILSHSQA